MTEIEKAINQIKHELAFYKQQIKEMESEDYLTTEEDYITGHSKALCKCYKAVESIEFTLQALREEQEREKGCGWCNKYRMEFNAIDDNENTVSVDHMVLGGLCNYCPVCGRKSGGCDG